MGIAHSLIFNTFVMKFRLLSFFLLLGFVSPMSAETVLSTDCVSNAVVLITVDQTEVCLDNEPLSIISYLVEDERVCLSADISGEINAGPITIGATVTVTGCGETGEEAAAALEEGIEAAACRFVCIN
jgi:hypothetical protein